MSMLRKEWTDEEIEKLNRDLKTAKVKVFANWGFSSTEIAKIMELPESIVRAMIRSQV